MGVSRAIPLPFAFLLALATDANSSPSPLIDETKGALEPGMLSGLLKLNGAPEFTVNSVEQVRDGKPTTVVQYFPNFPNFRNCFNGTWRNC